MTEEQIAELKYEAGMYQSLYENAAKEIERLRDCRAAIIEQCAKIAEEYPASSAATEHPVEYWIRQLSFSQD